MIALGTGARKHVAVHVPRSSRWRTRRTARSPGWKASKPSELLHLASHGGDDVGRTDRLPDPAASGGARSAVIDAPRSGRSAAGSARSNANTSRTGTRACPLSSGAKREPSDGLAADAPLRPRGAIVETVVVARLWRCLARRAIGGTSPSSSSGRPRPSTRDLLRKDVSARSLSRPGGRRRRAARSRQRARRTGGHARARPTPASSTASPIVDAHALTGTPRWRSVKPAARTQRVSNANSSLEARGLAGPPRQVHRVPISPTSLAYTASTSVTVPQHGACAPEALAPPATSGPPSSPTRSALHNRRGQLVDVHRFARSDRPSVRGRCGHHRIDARPGGRRADSPGRMETGAGSSWAHVAGRGRRRTWRTLPR